MNDFHNRPITAGDILAVAMTRGRGAVLEQRFVRSVHDGWVEVQKGPEPPTDKREIGRVTNTRNSIIIS